MNLEEHLKRLEQMQSEVDKRFADMQKEQDERMKQLEQQLGFLNDAAPAASPVTSEPIFGGDAEVSHPSCRTCQECGASVSEDAIFCEQCGCRLEEDSDEELDEDIMHMFDDDDDDQEWCENEDDTLSDERNVCPVDWENFEDCGFTYTYESDGEEREVEVTYELCEDADGDEMYSWCCDGDPIDISDDDFHGCEDINDCGVVIAKKVIHDNDGEVRMSFGKGELTFTDQPCAIVLDENLNYSTDCEDTVTLTLYANQGCDVMQTNFYDLDEETFESIRQLLEDGETDEIWDYIDEEFFCNETFDLVGDEEAERLGYEITDSDGDVIDEGEIHVGEENVFSYSDIKDNFAVTMHYHPQYLLVTTDNVKRSYAEYEVPAHFSIGGISFVKYDNAEKNIIRCEHFGDTVTCITQIRYAGQTYSCNDMGDGGTSGYLTCFLYAWDDDDERYRLVEQA